MSEMIDRDEVIEIIESVCSADDTYWKPGTLEKIRNLPTHPTPSNTLGALDCVDRQAAIDAVKEYFKFSPLEGRQCAKAIERVPSAQPETHDKRTETHGVCLDAIDRQASKRMTERNVGLRNATNDKKAWSE